MTEPAFYVGYKSKAPSIYNRARILFAAIAVALAAAIALVGAASQKRQPDGTFEFGNVQPFEGIVRVRPIPHLFTYEAVSLGDSADSQELLLVGFGKTGPGKAVLAADGQGIRFDGTLIYKDTMGMVEVTDPDSLEIVDGDPVEQLAASAGESVRLVGELVDTKCYLGVMRPGEGKVHRACAVRCLSGGIPPGILVQDGSGTASVYLLSASDGTPLDFDPQWAARTISVEGELQRYGDLPVVQVDALNLL